jgi:hypothetical protein
MTNTVTNPKSVNVSATGWQVTENKGPKALDATPSEQAVTGKPKSGQRSPLKSEPNDVGTALRNAFRATVEEDIPIEMLDLLRRLD